MPPRNSTLRACAPLAVAARVTVLNDEVRHDPVNRDAAIIVSLGKSNEIVYCQWGFAGEQLNSKRTFGRSHYGIDSAADSRERAALIGRVVSRLHDARLLEEIAGAVGLQKRRGATADEIVGKTDRHLNRFVCGGGFLFCQRVENREGGVV